MTCHNCRIDCRKFGKRGSRLRYQCQQCRKVFTDVRDNTLDGMYLPIEKAEMVLKMMLEGNSISSIERMTEVHHTTILKLLLLAGQKAERIMATRIVNVEVRDVELDEAWSFIHKKEKHVRPGDDPMFGDCYVHVALERHSKLAINIVVGKRDQVSTDTLVEGLRTATRGKFQVTSDGWAAYRSAVTTTLHDRITGFAQLIKVYRTPQDGEKRYSPAEVSSVEVVPVCGQPDPERICTSIVERSNLTLRTGLRRFTRLTCAFSRKFEYHAAAVMLWYCWYNFGRVSRSIRMTPAMAANVSDHIWSVRELLEAA